MTTAEMSEDYCTHCDDTGEVPYLDDPTDFGPCPYCQPEPPPSQAEIDKQWERNRQTLLRAEEWGLI